MIELYRPVDCPECADIEAALKEMVIAHKVIIVEPEGQPDELPAGTSLPALKERREIISGHSAIFARVKELQKFIHDWNIYQGDACYIDETGAVC